VIDVRPDDLIDDDDAAVFAATRRCCEAAGWRYSRLGTLDPVYSANLRWLAGYRHPRCLVPATATSVVEQLSTDDLALGALADLVGPRVIVMPTIFHLIWTHRVAVGLHGTRLNMATIARLPEEAKR
jgi:hypothetical protein